MPERFIQQSFNGGEISEEAKAWIGNEQYLRSVAQMQNFLPMRQGGVRRLPGTYLISRTESGTGADQTCRIFTFQKSAEDFVVLEFTNQQVRVLKLDGTVEKTFDNTAGNEAPWETADLPNLDVSQPDDKIWVADGGTHPIRRYIFDGTSWSTDSPNFDAYDTQDWTTGDNYPSIVEHFESRTILGPTNDEPYAMWGSVVFEQTDFTKGTNATDAWKHIMTAPGRPAIQWVKGKNALFIGTTAGPYKVGSIQEAITPSTIFHAKPQSAYGCAPIEALFAGESIFYVQKSGRIIRAIHYSQERETYRVPDVTFFASHMTESGVKEWAHQGEPESIIWVAREDGKLASATVDEMNGVFAWALHDLAGEVENVAVGNTADEDILVLVVKREIDGYTERHIEYMAKHAYSGQENAHFLFAGKKWNAGDECGIRGLTQASPAVLTTNGTHTWSNDDFIKLRGIEGMTEANERVVQLKNNSGDDFDLYNPDGSAFDTTAYTAYVTPDPTYPDNGKGIPVMRDVSGLTHLDRESVGVYADGATLPDIEPLGGDATIQDWATIVHVGLPSETRLVMLPMSDAIGFYTRIHRIYLRFKETVGMAWGQHEREISEKDFRRAVDAMDTPVPELSGFHEEVIIWDMEQDGQMELRAVGHSPFFLLNAKLDYEVYG